MFLKNHYGVCLIQSSILFVPSITFQIGYHMTIAKAANCRPQEIIHLVQRTVGGAKLESNV